MSAQPDDYFRIPPFLAFCVLSLAGCGQPDPADGGLAEAGPLTAADYTAAAALLEGNVAGLVKNARVEPHWLGETGRFWYRRDTESGHEYVVFDAATREKSRAFDHDAAAAAISAALDLDEPLNAASLALGSLTLADDLSSLQADVGTGAESQRVACTLQPMSCSAAPPAAAPADRLISPDGRYAVFAKEDNLHITDFETGNERRLTADGLPGLSYGKWPDTTLITIPRRKTGWPVPPYMTAFSPDSRYLIAPRIDERRLPAMPFVEWVPTDGSRRPAVHNLRMPIAGDAEALGIDFFAIEVESGEAVPIALPEGHHVNSLLDAGVLGWSTARGQAFMAVATADAQSAALVRVDLDTGEAVPVIEETSAVRLETNTLMYNRPNIRLLGDGDEVVWYSDRSGWGHLYLHDAQTGELKGAITSGEWAVFDIHALDEEAREIHFTAGGREAGRDPYYRHLYRASLDGGAPVLLTDNNADHMIPADPIPLFTVLYGRAPGEPLVRPDLGFAIDTWSTVDRPPVTVLRSTRDGSVIAELERADATALFAAGWQPPVRQVVKAADGATDIATVYYAPMRTLPGGRHPVIDSAYGGPQVYVAPRNFMEAHLGRNPVGESALARLGFAVAVTDARGTPARGNAFRNAGYIEFTQVGIDDHIAAIRQLSARYPEIDLERAGIYGWSWGGTFAAQAILSRPAFYDVAVSGAGVYDYAAIYPGFEPNTGVPVYANGSPLRTAPDEYPANWAPLDITALAGNLNGHLLLIYGDLDENVPPVQVFRLIDALVAANKPYDLLALPNRAHGAAGEGYVIQRTWDYFVRHLNGMEPPRNVQVTNAPVPLL
ncbi:MAG: DPP IV N-terminal domain-containing protein [Gammaproteobacteria bacterium]|nr:DPP IV N-terminal domain-containing protein [Gammaproteobacteria bacterium]